MSHVGWKLGVVGVLLAVLAGACDSDGGSAESTIPRVPKWSLYEVAVDRPVSELNPFDAAAVAVYGEFQSPGGARVDMPGFVNRPFIRQFAGGREQLTPDGDLRWTIRFTPNEEGRWSYRPRIETPQGIDHGAWTDFVVTPPLPGARGFVRRSARDHRYLEFDDGTSFWAVGENLAWYDDRGTFDYDEWMSRLAAQGCNYIRLWMPSWAFGLEWITRDSDGLVRTSSLGNYAERLDRAWQLDYVVELARRHGIYVMLSIQNHGAFSQTTNSEWSDNPYNAANGGPLQNPAEFFTQDEARALFKRRLRYIVARWGYSPNIMAWELWNEVDLVDQPATADLSAWHREMAAEIHALDPYDHLISTSISTQQQRMLWALDEIDFAQIHLYSADHLALDFTTSLPSLTARLQVYGKPVMVAEAGVDFRGPAETVENDPEGDGFHDILWSGLAAQTFGSGMTWWWDNVIDPQNLYFHFGPLVQFTAGVDFPGEGFVTRTLQTTAGARAISEFVLQGRTTVLVWVKNSAHQWYAPDPAAVDGGVVEVDGLGAVAWRATWFDTRSGARTVVGNLQPQDGRLTLEAPSFQRDIALRLERQTLH